MESQEPKCAVFTSFADTQPSFFVRVKKRLCTIWRESQESMVSLTWCWSSGMWPEGYLILGNLAYIPLLFYVFLLMFSDSDWVCQPFVYILNLGRALKAPICVSHGWNALGGGVRVGWHEGEGTFGGWDLEDGLGNRWVVLTHLLLMSPLAVPQVAARTGETGVRRRTQAMSRSASKRRSRFSSLWGLDTTSKKKQGRPSINQVGSRVDEKASVDCSHGHLTLGCACVCIVPWLILLYHIN